MTTTTRLMTADELWRMPSDGNRHELVEGELRTMAPAGGEHGAVVMDLAAPVAQFVKANKLGRTFGAETGFIVARNPDTVRAPDFAFISQQRIPPAGIPKKFVPIAPDLVVEVVSPSDTLYELDEKVEQWLAAGTKLVWVANPRRKTIAVHRLGQPVRVLTTADALQGEDVLPGFSMPVNEAFA